MKTNNTKILRSPGESFLEVAARLILKSADDLYGHAHYTTLNRLAQIAGELRSIEDEL